MYQTRDARIDSDHDAIITLFGNLCEIGPCHGYDCTGRGELIRTLLEYTSTHFREEEALMRRVGYPELREHLLAHAYLQREFRARLGTMPEHQPNLAADAQFLRSAFLGHILSHDDTFAQWLEARHEPRGLAAAREAESPDAEVTASSTSAPACGRRWSHRGGAPRWWWAPGGAGRGLPRLPSRSASWHR